MNTAKIKRHWISILISTRLLIIKQKIKYDSTQPKRTLESYFNGGHLKYLWTHLGLRLTSALRKLLNEFPFIKSKLGIWLKSLIESSNEKKIITDDTVNKIKMFWQKNSHKPPRLCDIKQGVWNLSENAPCDSTLSSILEKKLNMSYRILSIQPPKTRAADHIRKYCESEMIQCSLAELGFESVYVDKFNISSHKSSFRGWGFKDFKSAITSSMDSFSMYFTLGVSVEHIYRLMVSERANTVEIFIHFLDNLIKVRDKVNKGNDSKFWCILDNASIHKTADVNTFAIKRKIHLLSIPSYSPALKGAETVIQAIKSKIKQRQIQGR